MKKLMVFGASLIILLIIINLVSAVRINEVELNPEGDDSGYEWVELYSETEINLTGWTLVNNDNDTKELNQTFQDYLIVNFAGQWLDNTNESLSLFDNGTIIDFIPIINDTHNDNRTWQYCGGNWTFIDFTKGSVNSCEDGGQDGDNNDNGDDDEPEIYLELDWDEEDIENGRGFEINVEAYNLKDAEYDLRVYLTFKGNSTIISERYDEGNDEWRSGKYYVNDFFSGPGNKTGEITLRIKDDYENFDGDARVFCRLRNVNYVAEEEIEILEKEEDTVGQDNQQDQQNQQDVQQENQSVITGSVIKLGHRKAETENGESDEEENSKEESMILYESGSEKIKKYAIYALNLVLIIIIIFLVKKEDLQRLYERRKRKKKKV